MTKIFKNLDEQITYLEKTKAVHFTDKESAKNYLLNSNYFNVISCAKVKFAQTVMEGRHIYESHNFEEWQAYFAQDCQVSEHLMMNMIEFERVINSRVAYFVSELIEQSILKPAKRNELIAQIKRVEIKSLPLYEAKETWKYITKMTFGELRYLLSWLYDNQKSVFNKVIMGYDFLRTGNVKQNFSNIVLLRNTLFHFTPLSIYLGFAIRADGRFDNRYRKMIVKFIFQLNAQEPERKLLDEIMSCADHFVAIKNS